MVGDSLNIESVDDCTEPANEEVLSCINYGALSLSESFMQQRKHQLLKEAEERERRSIRENHLKRETFKIIESLIEGKTDEEYMIKCASLLCQTDLDNVHEERSLAFFCGYPLCDNRLEQISAKKKNQIFKIDARNRQVYKMEEFNLFCSVLCYKSSYYLREQMSAEPLWMRYTDVGGYEELYRIGFDTLKLFRSKTECSGEDSDEMETMRQASRKSEIKEQISVKESVSFPYIKQEHLEHLRKSIKNLTIKERNVTENSSELEPSEKKLEEVKKVSEQKHESEGDRRLVKIECENITEKLQVPINSTAKSDLQPATKVTDNQSVFERLKEWMTFESLIFIFGNSIIDEMIQLRRLKISEDSGQEKNDEELRKKKMQEDIKKMCKRLDEEEILDQLIFETDQVELGRQKAEKIDHTKRKLNGNDVEMSKQRKGQSGSGKKVSFDPTVSVAVSNDPPPPAPLFLPPTSSGSQNRLRKQLFCRQLERTISLHKINPEVAANICPAIRDLIDTFKFTSTNVVVPTDDWPELLIFLLKILEIRGNTNSNFTGIMTERSVADLCQKVFPEVSSLSNFDSNISILLDYHKSRFM